MIFYRLLMIVIFPLTVLAACSSKPEQKPPPPPMNVGVLSVDRGAIEHTLDMSGTLTFIANTTVSSEVSAQVTSLEVTDGQPVNEGQLLLVFDETKIRETANQAQANLQKDEATLTFNKTEWEKNLELLKTGSVSQTQFDQKLSSYQNAVAQVEADKAVLAKAKEDLKKTRVLSPITGLLSNRFIERGDWVSEGGKLFLISDYSRIYLEAFLSDMEVGRLDVGKVVKEGVNGEVSVDSYPGKIFKGKLTYIQPVASQARLFQIRIYLDNSDMVLLQGMFARGRIVVKTIPGVLRVPVGALMEQVRVNDTNTVFLVDENKKAQLTRVKIGTTDPRYAEVLEGLKEGAIVVVQGKEILNTGQPLKITELPNPQKSVASSDKETSDKSNGGYQLFEATPPAAKPITAVGYRQ
ncbi:MAG: efflux RND transporter periplasmic adaptor subunit [Desulfomonilaceae bacterium]